MCEIIHKEAVINMESLMHNKCCTVLTMLKEYNVKYIMFIVSSGLLQLMSELQGHRLDTKIP